MFNMAAMLDSEKQKTTLEYLKFWLMSIKLHAPNAIMLLVGTHLDKVSEEEDIDTIDILIRQLLLSSAKFDYCLKGSEIRKN